MEEADRYNCGSGNYSASSRQHFAQQSVLDKLKLWVYRYNLQTALYMLDPWERILFNTVVLVIFAYVTYGVYGLYSASINNGAAPI